MTFRDMVNHEHQMAGATRFLRLFLDREDILEPEKQYLRLIGLQVLSEMNGPAAANLRTPTNPATHEKKGTPL